MMQKGHGDSRSAHKTVPSTTEGRNKLGDADAGEKIIFRCIARIRVRGCEQVHPVGAVLLDWCAAKLGIRDYTKFFSFFFLTSAGLGFLASSCP
jgi:hypothetical protein